MASGSKKANHASKAFLCNSWVDSGSDGRDSTSVNDTACVQVAMVVAKQCKPGLGKFFMESFIPPVTFAVCTSEQLAERDLLGGMA